MSSMMHTRASPRGTSFAPQRRFIRSVCTRAASTDVKEPAPTTANEPAPTRFRTLDELPVEKGLPFLGVILDVVTPEYDVHDLFEKHNCDAFMINLGPAGGMCLALQTAEDLEECTVTNGKHMYPKWPVGVEKIILPLGRSATNEEIKPFRVAFSNVLSQGAIMKLQLPQLVQQFSETVRKHALSGEEVKWWYISRKLTFSVAMRAGLGDVLSKQDIDDLFPLASDMGQGTFSVNFGLKEGLPFTNYWSALKAQKQLIAKVSERIEEVLEDREKLHAQDSIVKRVLEALEAEGVDTSSSNGKDIVMRLTKLVIFLTFTGTDTTAFVISKTMTYLAKHPQWITALAEEQQRLMVGYGDELGQKVLSRSAVALACAQEALRLKPPFKILFRLTTKDLTISDIAVPEGTMIALCARKATRETGTGQQGFDPQQWLSEDNTKCTVNTEAGNIGFGRGNRNCVGKNLAVIELTTFLAVLGREVQGINMSQEEIDRDFFLIGDHPTGLPLSLVPRSP